jgi:diguanylate cyclase (GGDEF)-like protein/PAS domain S-box-containing protein
LRSEAELQAREHERRFRATFDQAAVGIVHTTLDGRYLQANRRFCEMVGYQANELIGRVAAELMHPQDRDKGAHYRQLMWDGKLDKLSEEKRYVRKDGSVLWTNRTISIARDESGQPMYFIRVIEDITEHKLAAQRRDMEHAVTAVLAESPTLEAAMPTIIRIICDGQQWACGFFWRWDEATELLRCADVWHADNAEIEDFVAFSRKRVTEAPAWTGQPRATPDLGPLRSTWFSGAPVWIADIAKRANFRRGTEAACANLHCAFCFPVLSGDRPLGVMEFFSREIKQPDEALLRAVQAIGRQIGQFIQRKLAEEAQRVSEERYRDMFDRSPSPMWVWDDETLSIITVNQAAIDHYGYSREEFEHMSLRELWVPSERARNEENIRERAQLRTMYVQSTHYTKDQRVISVEVTARAFKLGSRSVWLTLVNDVTERLRVEEKLLHLAHYDTLTDLPNRVLFYDRLRKTLALSKRNGWITGVLFMDIDRFKNINDTLGHAVGDQLLRQVSERLVCSVRASDTVGRLGGDEFAVVLTNLTLDTDAGVVAQKIIDKFNEPFRLDGAEVYVTPSIGITLYPKDGTEQDELIKHADAAMYRAKDSGRNNFQYYSPEMSVRGQAVLQLEGSLRRALEHDEFLLHYQPKADIASGVINGCEALLRWQRLGKGLVSPAEFIPVLEETGLIVQAGEWVLNTVCKQINTWLSAGITPVPIAVNLSARQFLQPDLGTTIERILASHNIDPKWIELEITESSLMANPQDAARVLGFLKSLGLSISIDDFGTGYSSLSYLKRFPLDALKIDRSFVRDISTDANDAAITRAVISMAHSLGLKVVAEGVETSEQLAFLAEHRCDIVQGYYLAKPLPAQQCTQALVERLRLKRPAA